MTSPGPHENVGARESAAAERRGEARHDVGQHLRSDYGPVADFSMHGVRILTDCRWSEGEVRRVCISSGTNTVVLDARCAWCRQDGLREHMVGLRFESVSEAQAGVIQLLLEDAGTPMM